MEYILKVSPKGQVTLPKKLRERLMIKGFVEVEISNHEGILKMPKNITEKIAGCFKEYTSKKKISIEKDIDKAIGAIANEVARKGN